MGFRYPWKYVRQRVRPVEARHLCFDQRPGAVVRRVHDYFVRLPNRSRKLQYSCAGSVLIPWVTLREVPVEVEIVGSPHYRALLQTSLLTCI